MMTTECFICIYCGNSYPVSECSLEHTIPQFLGGNYASKKFQTRDSCKACNNKLGLFVDASYAKSYFVINYLALAARQFYCGSKSHPLPLSCMGYLTECDIDIPIGYVLENWLGPSGECIFWIRCEDEKMYWYSGGNPTHRKKPTTAFLSLTDKLGTHGLGIKSFLQAFKGKNARKILLQEAIDGNNNTIILPNFDVPTNDEKIIATKLLDAVFSKKLQLKTSMHTKFDQRFIAKLVIGIGYSLFGKPFLLTEQALSARNDLWPSMNSVNQLAKNSSLGNEDNNRLRQFTGYPGAISILVLQCRDKFYFNMSLNQAMLCMAELAPHDLSCNVDIREGFVILLFPYLKRTIELKLVDLISHTLGYNKNPELCQIDEILALSKQFWNKIKTDNEL